MALNKFELEIRRSFLTLWFWHRLSEVVMRTGKKKNSNNNKKHKSSVCSRKGLYKAINAMPATAGLSLRNRQGSPF